MGIILSCDECNKIYKEPECASIAMCKKRILKHALDYLIEPCPHQKTSSRRIDCTMCQNDIYNELNLLKDTKEL